MLHPSASPYTTRLQLLGLAILLVAGLALVRPASWAQEPKDEDPAGPSAPATAPADGGPSAAPAAEPADAAAGSVPPDSPPAGGAPAGSPAADQIEIKGINFFTLLISGGWFMVPIAFMSLVAVTFTIERGLAIRRPRVIPDELVTQLGQLGGAQGGFDPRQAYRLCQQYPSAAASVIRAMLLKVGRPHSEVEHAVDEAVSREAERMYANVRWLNLSASVAPLMGLLGTVWGMIVAFHDTTQLPAGINKANYLAEGIYVALVTTLGGLIVAIPAAMLSHYFEGRIMALFHEVDELLFNLMPQVERYEGRVRFSQRAGEERPAGEPASATS